MRIFFLLIYIMFIFSSRSAFSDETFDKYNINIPKGYNLIKEEGIIDGNTFSILNLEDIKKNKKRLIIINKNDSKIFFDSDKVISYPKSNGNGYIIRSLIALIENNWLIIQAEVYSGVDYSESYYFKLSDNRFFLKKYIRKEGVKCNNWTVGKAYENSDFKFKLYLEDFSLDSPKVVNLISSSKRVILNSFDTDFNNLQDAFLYKRKSLKKEAIKIIAFNDKQNKNCSPDEYLFKYLYFDYSNTISKSNDIAFFFEQAGYYEESIYLLEKIIGKYPNRTVAYINLGDAYWGLKDTNKAKQAYKKYIELMKASNKEQRIPKRIYERIAQEDE